MYHVLLDFLLYSSKRYDALTMYPSNLPALLDRTYIRCAAISQNHALSKTRMDYRSSKTSICKLTKEQ